VADRANHHRLNNNSVCGGVVVALSASENVKLDATEVEAKDAAVEVPLSIGPSLALEIRHHVWSLEDIGIDRVTGSTKLGVESPAS
jgi:hypothetical protein